MPLWLSAKDVASKTGQHEKTIRRWCQRGVWHAKVTPGGYWRVLVDEKGWPVERGE